MFSQHSLPAAYVRTASTSIAAYEYLRTIPTAVMFYWIHWKNRCVSMSSCLFVLIRLTSIAILISSNVAFFYRHFSQESCTKFHLVTPSLKVLQIMVSQCIMGVRTYNLSRRSRPVGSFLIILYVVASGLQWYFNMIRRTFFFDSASGHCLGTVAAGRTVGIWVYYVVAIIYDVLTTAISMFYLLKYKFTLSHASVILKLVDSMLYEGLGYFVILTMANAANLTLFRSTDAVQGAAVTVSYVVTWIMSQRLLINLHEARMRHQLQNAVAMGATVKSQYDGDEPSGTDHHESSDYGASLHSDSHAPDDEWTVSGLREGQSEGCTHREVRVRFERSGRMRSYDGYASRRR